MDFNEDNSSGFDREAADQLYQLLLDLHYKGSSDIYVDPRALLSSEIDAITAINRSAALEKEAQDILKVFTNAPVTPVLRDVSTALINLSERALVPRNNINIVQRRDCYKINVWKDNELVTSIRNNRARNVLTHFINIKIEKNGSFIITGLENVEDNIREVIQELGGLIAIEDGENFTRNKDSGVEIKEITESNLPMIEIPLHDGILKFTINQNPIDVLSEIYCTEETDDNKIIFKVPVLGDYVVSADDDPIKVFKDITGYDLTDFYKTFAPENLAIEDTPHNDETENKENEKKVKTKKQRHKKNKQKRKSKKRK